MINSQSKKKKNLRITYTINNRFPLQLLYKDKD